MTLHEFLKQFEGCDQEKDSGRAVERGNILQLEPDEISHRSVRIMGTCYRYDQK